jgi:hypothetical protein
MACKTGGESKTGPSRVEITPRQLFFAIFSRHRGKINRANLIDEIEDVTSVLWGKGYRVNIGFKGYSGHWRSEDLDSEIALWKGSVIEEVETNFYKFVAPDKGWKSPYTSIEYFAERALSNLDKPVQNFLLTSEW